MSGHHSATMDSCHWLTPPWILDRLGDFDLDPCAAPDPRPWPTASHHITVPVDGLTATWAGRVWLNPPYSRWVGRWLSRLAAHGYGTALVFARTETTWFRDWVWRHATGLLFLTGRVRFYRPSGVVGAENGGAPSVLVAYGQRDAHVLEGCGLAGAYVPAGWQVTP